MMTSDRYLHFDNIDVSEPAISAWCSRCAREFTAEPRTGERVDDVLLRIRTAFDAHVCSEQAFAPWKKSV
jgi:hypothetical protein